MPAMLSHYVTAPPGRRSAADCEQLQQVCDHWQVLQHSEEAAALTNQQRPLQRLRQLHQLRRLLVLRRRRLQAHRVSGQGRRGCRSSAMTEPSRACETLRPTLLWAAVLTELQIH